MKRIAFFALALLAAGTAPAGAQDTGLTGDPDTPIDRVGQRGATFLDIGVGARAQALAGAYVASANDVSSLYWNTSGIGHIEGFAAGFSQAHLYSDLDITHTFAGGVLPVGLSRFGISFIQLSSGEMAWTNEEYPNAGFGGPSDPLRGSTNARFEWTSTAIGGHYARPITDRLMVGGAIKYITEGISGAEADFVAVDLGTQFETGLFGITLGASLTNLGSEGRMSGEELRNRINTSTSENQVIPANRIVDVLAGTRDVQLPTAFHFSLMADLLGGPSAIIAPNPTQSVRLMWDLSDASNTGLQSAIGVEYSFNNLAFVRVGKRWTNEAQIEYDFDRNLSFGGGVRLPIAQIGNLMVDYAYTGMGELENVQLFSIEVHF